MWQRLLSRQILRLQIQTFKDSQSFMPEISTILYGQIDEFKAVKAKAVRMRSFKALSSKSCYAIELT